MGFTEGSCPANADEANKIIQKMPLHESPGGSAAFLGAQLDSVKPAMKEEPEQDVAQLWTSRMDKLEARMAKTELHLEELTQAGHLLQPQTLLLLFGASLISVVLASALVSRWMVQRAVKKARNEPLLVE